ncbi:prephenate dehydratase [Pacificimonas flava]|uniref:prephenate dehydratase n=2 Tax=Pacificimonas TaxID=1960290 RepID=A0A219B2P5_9SPHN|nr:MULTISPECIES: prephenate dehydratase [Pacificimonas]MBZ6377937.1 prephenate dehydratase [Pacificimonas aurantium]OWV32406.1 prephenate dehydratase [Pacificimonas flava]
MDTYPPKARELVSRLSQTAEASPETTAAFQGAPGAYSHQAVRELFPDFAPLPCVSFGAAIDAVSEGRARYAVIPIENSQHGRVADIHFLLPESGLSITHEHFVRVSHCLLARPGTRREEVREAFSHAQALGQCRRRLEAWDIKPRPTFDTAGAAALVAEETAPGRAAIASALAAELYGLDILERGIEDAEHNTTRFVALSRKPASLPAEADVMTTLMFEVRSVPAALFKALGGFATNGVNLTKIESYLRDGVFQAAEFYIDIEGHPDQPEVARAMDELGYFTKWVRVLGTYERARAR